LHEETIWEPSCRNMLQWYPGTVCTTDSIGEGYHYLIAHCFATIERDVLPELLAADDAADVGWWQLDQIQEKIANQQATPGVDTVILRMQELSQHGLLPMAPLTVDANSQ
jgi:hypothetical protein